MKKYTKPEFTIASFEATDFISLSVATTNNGIQQTGEIGHINFN